MFSASSCPWAGSAYNLQLTYVIIDGVDGAEQLGLSSPADAGRIKWVQFQNPWLLETHSLIPSTPPPPLV